MALKSGALRMTVPRASSWGPTFSRCWLHNYWPSLAWVLWSHKGHIRPPRCCVNCSLTLGSLWEGGDHPQPQFVNLGLFPRKACSVHRNAGDELGAQGWVLVAGLHLCTAPVSHPLPSR